MIADASRDSRTDRDIEVDVCNFLDFSCLIAEVIWVRFRREALLSPRLRHCRSSCCQRSKAWSRQSDSSCPSKWWSEWSDAFNFWLGDECEIISERGQVFQCFTATRFLRSIVAENEEAVSNDGPCIVTL